jgi:hypothetical protein
MSAIAFLSLLVAGDARARSDRIQLGVVFGGDGCRIGRGLHGRPAVSCNSKTIKIRYGIYRYVIDSFSGCWYGTLPVSASGEADAVIRAVSGQVDWSWRVIRCEKRM